MDSFDDIPTDTNVVRSFYQIIQSQAAITDEGPYSYLYINKVPNHFLHLPSTKLYCVFSVNKEENGKLVRITSKDQVSVTNLVSSAFFSAITAHVNNQRVNTNSSYGYQYTSFIDCELNYSKDAKATTLGPALYAKDTLANFDTVKEGITDKEKKANNLGFIARKKWIENDTLQF